MPDAAILVPGEKPPEKPTPAVNVPDVAAAMVQNGAMGIAGQLRQSMMNMSAMAILAGGAVWAVYTLNQNAKEERALFGTTLDKLNDGLEARYNRTEATHSKAMEKMGNTIERSVSAMERATRALEKTAAKIPDPDGGGP